MSREDIATIFPEPEKFVVGMKLYRVVQNVRCSSSKTDVNTCQLLNDLDALEDEAQSTKSTSSECSAATRSTLSLFSKHSSDHSVQTPSRKRSVSSGMATNLNKVPKLSEHDKSRMEFKLPIFSPDIEKCIRKDAFYTSAQRNKLIREACRALQGYCREQDRPVSNDDKRLLAHLLYERAPKSLGDLKPTPGKEPEVKMF